MPSPEEKTTTSSAIDQDLLKTTEKEAEFNVIDFPDAPKVVLAQGEVVGLSIVTANGKILDAYFGVPYAEKPVRFARAKEIRAWTGVRTAFVARDPCPRRNPGIVIESCLYLNVLKPRGSESLPLLVWFLGDGMNGEEDSLRMNFSALAATENIVVITVSFRVGVFGFLNASLDDIQGDIGIHDQRLALEFINENVEAFGGRRDKITIGGFGFSGSIAGMHLLDETASHLFQRIVLLSGTPFMLNRKTFRNPLHEFLRVVRCDALDPVETVECIRMKHTSELHSGLNFGPNSGGGTNLPGYTSGNAKIRGQQILLGSYAYSGWKDDTDIREFVSSRDPDSDRLVMLKEAVELCFDSPMASVENRNIFRAYAPSAPNNLQGKNFGPEILRLIGEMRQDLLHRCASYFWARNSGLANEIFVFEIEFSEKPRSELKFLLDPSNDIDRSRKSSDLSRDVRQQLVSFIRGG
ncbi:acetylcholinesterase-like [Galendromus occidentalis]|uniref:Acetylcholinesterase-like n=1 Tax=Galendromus occidentalis TaxID=34638 RepID=A0AAJ6QWJ7_9ACAR|nr:acetylcholinesterase-like [Galendromus occidentalis]